MLNSYTADQLLQTQEMGMSFHYLFPADLADDLGEDPMLAVNLFDIRRSEMFLSFRTNYSDIGDVVVLFMPRFMCLLRVDHDEFSLNERDALPVEYDGGASVEEIDHFKLMLPVGGVVLAVVRDEIHEDSGVLGFIVLLISCIFHDVINAPVVLRGSPLLCINGSCELCNVNNDIKLVNLQSLIRGKWGL